MVLAVVALALVVLGLLAWGFGRMASRQQASMRGGSEDLRRADDGGDPGYSDFTSPMG